MYLIWLFSIAFSLIAYYRRLTYSSIRVIWQICLLNSCRGTFPHLPCNFHGTPPPYVRFRIRRFFSFHKLLDNSQAWMCILAWLLFYSLSLSLTQLIFSNISFGSWQVPLPSNVRVLTLSTFGTWFLPSFTVSNRPLGFYALPIRPLFWVVLSYLRA